ncbi:hypothetical protein C2G38_2190203 [Gigaspora rosea]|uniref:Uncharacterized protein n=1 Tax=Gigaspora rosea TaxID=44941 RepID=A0A397V405_9GLOM|nr:hypothetical protein C2G38_2190203 [Gigaspora rosea]
MRSGSIAEVGSDVREGVSLRKKRLLEEQLLEKGRLLEEEKGWLLEGLEFRFWSLAQSSFGQHYYCQAMFNPKNKIIMMLDHIVKKLIAINLNKLKYGEHFPISSSEDDANKKYRDKSDDNDSENDNTEQESKHKNNSNYFDKMNKRPRVMDLDPEEVQEAKKDPDKDVDKEKNTNDYEKNMDIDK